MAIFDKTIATLDSYSRFQGYTGNPPTTEAEYDAMKDAMYSETPPTWADIQAAMAENDLVKLRVKRNELLAETDYWMMSDTAEATTEQLSYRQALRDITATYSSLEDVVWPIKPGA
jgi:hypothetical protein